MNELEQCRREIERIDGEMARLFEARMNVCEAVADYKKAHGLSVRDPAREAELIRHNGSRIENEAIASYYTQFLRSTIDLSCAYQSRLMEGMRVAYCGTEGAFAHIAAKKMFPDAELVSFHSFAEAYGAVERGDPDCVVLPLENSYAGEVGTVMDLMFSGGLYVNQVIDLDIVHHLLGCENATADTVKTVYSHPQALEQCGAYLRSRGYETVPCSNTALAAKQVLQANDPTLAAVASDETAQALGLKILDRHINAARTNTTRFAAFSRVANTPSATHRRDNENFILVFTVRNEAGALAQTLNIIGAHGFNMRNLRSRPRKDLLWSYFFYIEAEGNLHTENGRDMLRELSAVCAQLKPVGSYFANNVE